MDFGGRFDQRGTKHTCVANPNVLADVKFRKLVSKLITCLSSQLTNTYLQLG